MLHNIIRHGTLVTVCALIICVLGIAAIFRIPVQMIPDLEVRTFSVITDWPGATPQDVEKEILVEQERYLRTISQVSRMYAYAETGRAIIELEFPFGVSLNEAQLNITNALSQVSNYPENVDQPRIVARSFSQNSFMFFALTPLPGNPMNLDMDMMYDFIDIHVRPVMTRVHGVADVDIRGGNERQIQIRVDPERLAQRGLELTDVRDAVRSRNRDISAGDVNSGKRRYLLRTIVRMKTVDDLKNIILSRDGDAEVRLQDVASVELDHFEVRQIAFMNGERVTMLSVSREPASNVIQIKQDMLPVVEELNQTLLNPTGMQLHLMSDDVRYVQASIDNVWTNLSIGASLATLTMLLFLRAWRPTLIGIMGTPLCTIAAFLGLLLFGRTINVISLAGIAFAIGMTFDNSIVVLESIDKARRQGLDHIEAALRGVQDVWSAVLASTLTTVLVFAPVLFVAVEAGQLYSDIAIAISSAILASMLTAIILVPTASIWLGKRMPVIDAATQHSANHRGPLLVLIDWLTATWPRQIGCILVVVALSASVARWLTPPAEYLPEGEEPKTFTSMIPPPGYNMEEMAGIAASLQAKLLPHLHRSPEDYDADRTGMPPLAYYYLRTQSNQLRLISEPSRAADIQPMMDTLTRWFREYPGMRAFSARGSIISSNDGGTRAVNIDIAGVELADLYATATNLYRRAEHLFDEPPQLSSEPGSLSLDQPLVEIYPRWERLAEIGLAPQDFGFAVAALSDGAFVDEFILDNQKIDIFLFSRAGNTQQLDQIAQLPVMTPSGDSVPLQALADFHESVDTDIIRRIDGHRTVTLRIIPPHDVPLETAVTRVKQELIQRARLAGEIPANVSLGISGAADQLEATQQALKGNALVALILCYLLLVAIFTHWGYPLVIMTTIPLGIMGGLAGLALLNTVGSELPRLGWPPIQQPFDMITMLGFLILLGTVVNNPILIVDRTRENLQHRYTDVTQAVREAVASRLRPILMSTATTVLGLAPLVLIPGAGTELYRGVGVIVLAGLVTSTIITLTFLPCLLILLLKLVRKNSMKLPQHRTPGNHPQHECP